MLLIKLLNELKEVANTHFDDKTTYTPEIEINQFDIKITQEFSDSNYNYETFINIEKDMCIRGSLFFEQGSNLDLMKNKKYEKEILKVIKKYFNTL